MKKTCSFKEEQYYSSRLQELRFQVAGGEGLHLEFKRKASDPEKIVRELVAFANTEGGTLLVGVADDGSIPGIKYPEEESFVIRQAILKQVRPMLRFSEEVIAVAPARYVLAYHIQAGKRLPYQIKQTNGLVCYVRINDQSIKASAEMRAVLRQRHRRHNRLIRYGEHEQLLMQHLARNHTITLQDFANLTKLSRKKASRKLVHLVLANLLKLTPTGKGDVYSLAFVA
jgi:predicted HTH transcriptional regulator